MKKLNLTVLQITLLLVVVSFFVFRPTPVMAACTATTGVWGVAGTWSGCNDGIPTPDDDVIIPSGAVVTVGDSVYATAASLTINNAGAATGIIISGAFDLNIIGAISLTAPTVDGTTSIDVGSGSLYGSSLTIAGGDGSKISQIISTGGSITVTNDITFTGTAANARLTAPGIMYVGGDIGGGGTFNGASGSIILNGTGNQTLGAYAGYNTILVTNSAGTVSFSSGVTTLADRLTLNANSTVDTTNTDLTVEGVTWIKDGAELLISSIDGSKTFTGNVQVDVGGAWTENAAEIVTFGGDLTNEGIFNANTGNHVFVGAGASLYGEIAIPSLVIDGTVTNRATTTAPVSLTGSGTLTNAVSNGVGGVLNLGGVVADSVLVAEAIGNTVNYNKMGDQDVKAIDYYNLTLSGSGIKTIATHLSIMNITSIASGVVANMTDESDYSSTYSLYFNGSGQIDGLWGATGSDADNINDVYLSGAGTIQTSDTVPPIFTAERTAENTIVLTFNEPVNASADTNAWTVAGASAVSSSEVVSDTTMTLTTTGLSGTAGTPEVNYVQASGDVNDEAIVPNELADGGAVVAADKIPPTLTITLSDTALAVGETSVVTFTFSEEPTGFANADVTTPNGTLSTVTVDDEDAKIYLATFTPTESVNDSTNIITVGTDWTDSAVALNAPVASTESENYSVDTVVPAVISSSRTSGGGGSVKKPVIVATTTVISLASSTLPLGQIRQALRTLITQFLTVGSSGSEVSELQNRLKNEGFFTGVPTGYYGPMTRASVMAYQRAHGITPLGYVGPATRAELNKSDNSALIASINAQIQAILKRIMEMQANGVN